MEDTLTHDIITMPSYEEFLEIARTNFQPKSRDDLINSLKKNISDYEQKYHMKSNDFVRRFEKGEFENNDKFQDQDLFRWWSDYKSYHKLIKKRERSYLPITLMMYEKLEKIALEQNTTVHRLIQRWVQEKLVEF